MVELFDKVEKARKKNSEKLEVTLTSYEDLQNKNI
jgi:hypothetical protein